MTIDANTLRAIAPAQLSARAWSQSRIIDAIGPVIEGELTGWCITSFLDRAHFLGQTCTESDGFVTTEEYADGSAYEGRRDLGNDEPGDGRKYKGYGLIQTTGKANQYRAADALGIPREQIREYLRSPIGALRSACLFWTDKKLKGLAEADDLIGVTRRVNGGTNGLNERRLYTAKAKAVLARMAANVIAGGAVTEPGMPSNVLARGDDGVAVEQLQRALRAAGFPVAIDGDFGAGTEMAVKTLQKLHNLTVDGIVGPKTWAKLIPQGA